MTVLIVHILLATVLFFVMNWVGGHAVVTARYYQVSYFSSYDEAPAFNSLFRILAPVVFIILTAAVFHALGLSEFVVGIYRVVIYQQIVRWSYLLLMNRWRLVRWTAQIGIALATTGVAVLIYRMILTDPRRLLPDPSNIANEVWLIVFAFLYKISDQAVVPMGGNRRRKESYLRARFVSVRERFRQVITESVDDTRVHPLVYSVLIYETFNRPALVQLLERWLPSLRPRSYGPMQVQAVRFLTDDESVKRGSRKLANDFRAEFERLKAQNPGYSDSHWTRRQAAESCLSSYNVRSDYATEVLAIHDFIVPVFFKDLVEELVGLG